MKKKLIFLLYAVLQSVLAFGQDTMYVYKTNGSVIKFVISEVDSVTFSTSATTNPPDLPSVCQNKTTSILIDASNNTGAASYLRNYICSVSNTQLSDTIYLDIKAQSDLDYIYITKSEDNGNSAPLIGTSNLFTDNAQSVVGSSSTYSYEIAPNKLVTAVRLKIPVNIRTSSGAIADVYTIWITNGSGDFAAPTKKTVIGPITLALNYKSNTPYLSASGLNIGDQYSPTPSYICTKGIISVLSGASLSGSLTTTPELAQALNSVDINLVRLNSTGTAIDNAGIPFFVGVGMRASLGFTSNIAGTNMTKYALLPSNLLFNTLSGVDLMNLVSPMNDKIAIEQGKSYVFLTQDGRKGVIRIDNLSLGSGYSAQVSIKVLTM